MRSLVRMAEAKGRYDWNQTSSLMALMVNLARDPRKSKPVKPTDFNPYAEPPPKSVLKGKDLTILRDVFCPPQKT